MDKPYSTACDKNREPILSVIRGLFEKCHHVLEVGSGSGQHAVYFAELLPHLQWHTSDRVEHHKGISLWLDEAGLSNAHHPLELDVASSIWPNLTVDAVFSANTAHIMHWFEVEKFFEGVGCLLQAGGLFVLYGPFNYRGKYTSDSNARFDDWLKARDKESGIRDFEALDKLADMNGMELKDDYQMPANNRILCWQKRR